MMDNQEQKIVASSTPVEEKPQTNVTQKISRSVFFLALFFVLFLISIVFFFTILLGKSKSTTARIAVSPTITMIVSPLPSRLVSPSLTRAEWHTYTFPNSKVSFTYPSEIHPDSQKPTLFKSFSGLFEMTAYYTLIPAGERFNEDKTREFINGKDWIVRTFELSCTDVSVTSLCTSVEYIYLDTIPYELKFTFLQQDLEDEKKHEVIKEILSSVVSEKDASK